MYRSTFCLAIAAIMLAVCASLRAADQPATPQTPATPPEMKLPPGWTMEDMQACMMASMPGNKQALLAKDIGQWTGKTTMWMGPDSEPIISDASSTITPIMDGRFIKIEAKGEMPGMGPYNGLGINGYDNVSNQFVSTWIDYHSTGIMNGTGELSADGKTLTRKYTFSCPLTKKPAVIRQVETNVDANTKKIEMFGNDPKSGKEFKMMEIAYTRKAS